MRYGTSKPDPYIEFLNWSILFSIIIAFIISIILCINTYDTLKETSNVYPNNQKIESQQSSFDN